MLERLKSIFAAGILSRYEITGPAKHSQLFTLSPGRCRKTLRPVLVKEYTHEGVEVERKLDALYRARPLVEILPSVRSRFIVTTVETQATDNRRVEILDAVSGPSLRELTSEGHMQPGEFVNAVTEAAEGLSHLHSLGLIHRGLTPDVISVGEDCAKITDLSLLIDVNHAKHGSTILGVTRYSAPEVIKRHPIDRRSDVFSLGAILYEGITGTPLFPNVSGFERILRIMNSRPELPSERNASISDELDAVIMKAIAKNPDDRFATVSQVSEALAKAPLPEWLGAHAPAFAA